MAFPSWNAALPDLCQQVMNVLTELVQGHVMILPLTGTDFQPKSAKVYNPEI